MSIDFKPTFLTLNEAVKKLENFAPLHLAEDWDNVGLLLEPSQGLIVENILLTIDLTENVINEALIKKINLIIAYHPPIFYPFKRLTFNSWKEKIILTCAKNQIAIYSPHTALDAIKGGINDWLISCFQISSSSPIVQSYEKNYQKFSVEVSVSDCQAFETLINLKNIEILKSDQDKNSFKILCNHSMLITIVEICEKFRLLSKITKLETKPIIGHGMGRICYLKNSLSISQIIEIIKKHLGLPYVRLALGLNHSKDTQVTCIAVCAGSGGSILKNVKADLIITGEMSHHEILNSIHSGSSLIICEHSNTERGYLISWSQVLKPIFSDKKVNLIISEFDQDPLIIT